MSRLIQLREDFKHAECAVGYANLGMVNDALEELRRSANTEFDPRLIDVFIQAMSAASEVVAKKNAVGKKPSRRR